jgi:spore germination protein
MKNKDLASQNATQPDWPEWTDNTGILFTLRQNFGAALKYHPISVGSKYPRTAGIFFLDGIANSEMVAEFVSRLTELRVDYLSESKELPRLIGFQPYPLFRKFQTVAAPEAGASALRHGQIIIALANDPTLLTGPLLFLSYLQKSSWKQPPWHWFSLIFRIVAFGMAIFSSATYIAIVSYQYYAIPLNLFFILAQTRLKSPLPPVMEVLLLELLFEIMRKGATKIQNSASLYIGTLGSLAVAAGLATVGLINPFAALFCGIAQVANLVLPIRDLAPTIGWLKLGSIIMTSLFGIIGAIITASLMVVHLVSADLSEFGLSQTETPAKYH